MTFGIDKTPTVVYPWLQEILNVKKAMGIYKISPQQIKNMNEADTCRNYVLPKLKSTDWDDEYITEQMVLTRGRIVPIGDRHTRKKGLRPDYVLFIRQNIPIAVVEAKAEYAHPGKGLQQAIQYAEMMGLKFAYSSNGKGIVEHDFITGMERNLDNFPSPDELWGRLKGTFNFESKKEETDALSAYWEDVGGKAPRYYQQVAINKAVNAVLEGKNRILLTMATGTGKTFVAFQIVWRLLKAKRKKRILYLADRKVLIQQAKTRTFSPLDQAIQVIQGKAVKSREVYFALYQALANPNTGENLYEKYPRDFFDLIIIDECHRGSANEDGSWKEKAEIQNQLDSAQSEALALKNRLEPLEKELDYLLGENAEPDICRVCDVDDEHILMNTIYWGGKSGKLVGDTALVEEGVCSYCASVNLKCKVCGAITGIDPSATDVIECEGCYETLYTKLSIFGERSDKRIKVSRLASE